MKTKIIIKLKSSIVMIRFEFKVQMFFNIFEVSSFLLSNRDAFWINWPREMGAIFFPVVVSVKVIGGGVVDGG